MDPHCSLGSKHLSGERSQCLVNHRYALHISGGLIFAHETHSYCLIIVSFPFISLSPGFFSPIYILYTPSLYPSVLPSSSFSSPLYCAISLPGQTPDNHRPYHPLCLHSLSLSLYQIYFSLFRSLDLSGNSLSSSLPLSVHPLCPPSLSSLSLSRYFFCLFCLCVCVCLSVTRSCSRNLSVHPLCLSLDPLHPLSVSLSLFFSISPCS